MSSTAHAPATKRLWMLNHYAATGTQAGGSRHLDLARVIAGEGWESEIFACSFDHVAREYTAPTSWRRPVVTRDVDGVLFHWVHSVAYYENSARRYVNMVLFCFYLLFFCITRRQKPSVVFGSSGHLLTPFIAWIVSIRFRVPFIMEVRDLWPDSLIQLGLDSKPIVAVLRWMEGFLYDRADLVIGVSKGIVAGVIRNGGSADKTILISHGIETDPSRLAIVAEREQIRAQLGWDGEFVVLWAGSLEPFNALDVVVDAAALVNPDLGVRIVLLGGGSEFESLRQRADAYPQVSVEPSVPRGESFRWMVAADAGLVVARPFDAFTGTRPRKLFDYMAARLPILCFVPGEASTVVEESGTGIAHDWATPESVAQAITWCVEHPAELQSMSEAGAIAAATTYSLDHSARLLLEALESLTSTSQG